MTKIKETIKHKNRIKDNRQAIARDILERKKAEEELHRHKWSIEEVFNNIREGVGIVDENETIIFCNPAYASIFDEKVEKILGKSLKDFVDNESFKGIIEQTEDRRTGKSSTYELKIETARGSQKIIGVTASPRFGDDGSYIGAFGSIRDITEEKNTQVALMKSEEKYRDLVDNSPAGVFQSTLKGQLIFVNDILVKMFQYNSQKDMVSGDVFRFYKNPDDRKHIIRKLKKEKRVNDILLEVVTKKGRTKFIHFSATLLGDVLTGTIIDITERFMAKKELSRTRAQLQHVIYSNPAVIYSCSVDSDGKKISGYTPTFISDNMEPLFGYKAEECLGKKAWWSEHIHPEDASRAIENMKRLFEEGHLVHEYRIHHKDGSYRWIRDELVLVKGVDGKVEEFVGSWSDITKWKEAEIALQESEEQWRSLTENSPDHILLLDKDFVIQYLNFAAPGLKVEEIIGTTVYSHYPREEQPELRKVLQNVFNTGENATYYAEYKLPDGEIRHYELLIAARIIESKMVGLTISARDITERKLVEDALKESEKRYRNLVDNAIIGIIQSTTKGEILFANQALADMAGFKTPEEMIAEGALPRYNNPKQREEWINKLKKDGRVDNFEAEMLDKEGNLCHGLSGAILEGNIITTVTVDITDRIKAVRALEKSQKELHNLTRQLESIREEERSSIAREIHDELGQSMTAMKMNLSWLRGKLGEDQKKLYNKVKSMENLVDENLQIVKRISTELRPSLLDDLGLTAAIEWHSEDYQEQTGTRCKLFSRTDDLRLDKDRTISLYRIYQEVMTNIYRHANATSVRIDLNRENAKVILSVRDNGTGIQEEMIANPHSLGIIGMKERAYHWGGEVDIKRMKNGTTVTVTIPLERREKQR